MDLIEQIIGPFFENASSLLEAFVDIIVAFFSLGYVAVRALTELFGGAW